MANILITGGAGYIGSHVVKHLSKTNHKLTIIDNLSTGRKENVLSGELIICDISHKEKMEQVFSEGNFDACFHFAGSIVVPDSVRDPLGYYHNNTVNTHFILELCQKHKVNNFIFSSTAAVYGEPGEKPVTEGSPVAPINPYGRTKLMTEWMLKDFSVANKDFEYVVLRYFNVAGADIDGQIGQCFPGATHLIKVACQTALGQKEKMGIFGDDYPTRDGSCIRDFIHIDDLAIAHCKSLEYLLSGGKSDLFNCGYGDGYTVKEVVQKVKIVSNSDFVAEIAPRREGDPARVVANSDKIKKVLKWEPLYNDLELICRTAYQWESKL